MLKKKTIEESFKDGTSLLHWLPWYSYDDGIFWLIDGSVGKIWEVSQIPCDLKSGEDLTALSKAIETFVVSLPENVTTQVILLTDEKIDDRLKKYEEMTEVKAGYAWVSALGKMNYLREHRKGLFDYQNYKYFPKRIRVIVTFRYFPPWLKITLIDKIISYFSETSPIKKKFQEHYYTDAKPYMNKITSTMEESFKRMGAAHQEIDAQGLIDIVFPLLNPQRYQKFNLATPTYNPQQLIRDQVLFNHPEATNVGWDFEGIKTGIVSINVLPSSTFPGMFSKEMRNRLPLTDLIPNLAIVMNIYKPSQLSEESSINKIKALSSLQQTGFMGSGSEANIQKARDASEAIRRRYTENVSILKTQIHFVIREESQEKLEKSMDEVYNFLHYVGCEGVSENIIGAVLYLQCLPLNFSHLAPPLRFTSRGRRILSDNLADMLPFYGTYRGDEFPAQLYLNRRGETVFFDIMESSTAPHMIIAGVTGAGKSFFTNDLIMSQMRLQSIFYILDKGSSYRRICELNQGQYVEIDPDRPICMNPFVEKELTSEKQSFLKNLLSEMAAGGEERWAVDRGEVGCIDTGIRNAYERHTGEKEITLSEVAQTIAESGEIGKRVAAKLQPFLEGGSYGGFFDGQNQFEFTAKFTVFELGGLDAKKDLQVIMLMNIMYFIRNRVSAPEIRGVRKFCLIDEAWTLLSTENTATFLKEAFKTYRKYGCCAGAITQQTQDLALTKGGQAVLANAPNRILLKQTPDVIARTQKDLGLTPTEAAMLETVTMAKGKFSEALIKTDTSSGIIRFVADPVSYWLYTTAPKDIAYLDKKKEELQGNADQAILEAAKEYPHGL